MAIAVIGWLAVAVASFAAPVESESNAGAASRPTSGGLKPTRVNASAGSETVRAVPGASMTLAQGSSAPRGAATAPPTRSGAAADPSRITLSLTGASISDVLRAIATHFHLNLVMMGEDSREVSVAFVDRTVDESLEEIMAGSSLAYIRNESTLRVMPGELPATQIFRLEHAQASRLALLVTQSASNATVAGDDASNILSVRGPAKTLEQIASLVRHADALPAQVLIRARLLEVGLTDETSLGIDWEALIADGDVTVSAMTALFPNATPTTTLEISAAGTDGEIDAIVRHIAANTHGRLLSSPEIVTANREPAKILVGERVPYTKATTETQTGATLQEIEFVDVGVKLEVTPQVARDGGVGLDVNVEISEVLDKVVAGTPRIGTREAHTRVTLDSGETLLIGGLMRTMLVKETAGIPFLSKIPVLGRLFRHDRTRTERTELVILLSPEIVGEAHVADGRRWADQLDAGNEGGPNPK